MRLARRRRCRRPPAAAVRTGCAGAARPALLLVSLPVTQLRARSCCAAREQWRGGLDDGVLCQREHGWHREAVGGADMGVLAHLHRRGGARTHALPRRRHVPAVSALVSRSSVIASLTACRRHARPRWQSLTGALAWQVPGGRLLGRPSAAVVMRRAAGRSCWVAAGMR